MNYDILAAGRVQLQSVVDAVVAISQSSEPRPAAAVRTLRRLIALVRDHLAHAEPVVYATAVAARGGRHEGTAIAALTALETFKDEWARFLYRWDPDAIARDWNRFGAETAELLGTVDARVVPQISVLCSLAIHYKLLPTTS